MKIDLKKDFAELYKVSAKAPVIVKVPKQKIIAVDGIGDPNTSIDFQHAIEALYGVAYTLKFTLKAKGTDFGVMPLEALWWSADEKDFVNGNKAKWHWKALIVQPNVVTKRDFTSAVKAIAAKKDPKALPLVKFELLHEGSSAQIMYVGAFANEGPTILRLHAFIKEHGYHFDMLEQRHHEIYLSDPRRTAPDKLKTIIRQPFVK